MGTRVGMVHLAGPRRTTSACAASRSLSCWAALLATAAAVRAGRRRRRQDRRPGRSSRSASRSRRSSPRRHRPRRRNRRPRRSRRRHPSRFLHHRAATITSAAGAQQGDVGSYCWSDQVNGPSECVHERSTLAAGDAEGEVRWRRCCCGSTPRSRRTSESIRPFQGTRSGYPDQRDRPCARDRADGRAAEGTWSMDLCAAWSGRGQTICWLFKLDVVK